MKRQTLRVTYEELEAILELPAEAMITYVKTPDNHRVIDVQVVGVGSHVPIDGPTPITRWFQEEPDPEE